MNNYISIQIILRYCKEKTNNNCLLVSIRHLVVKMLNYYAKLRVRPRPIDFPAKSLIIFSAFSLSLSCFHFACSKQDTGCLRQSNSLVGKYKTHTQKKSQSEVFTDLSKERRLDIEIFCETLLLLMIWFKKLHDAKFLRLSEKWE